MLLFRLPKDDEAEADDDDEDDDVAASAAFATTTLVGVSSDEQPTTRLEAERGSLFLLFSLCVSGNTTVSCS